MNRPLSCSVAALLCALAACTKSTAPPATAPRVVDRSDGTLPTLRAARVPDGSITLDGKLDEPAWRSTGTTGALVSPGNGRHEPRSRVQGEARFLWDGQNLYLATVIGERDPVSPFTRTDVDPHLWERASAIELMLQPGDPGDNRHYYELQVDVHEAIWDTFFDDYNAPVVPAPDGSRRYGHQDWNSRLQRVARIETGEGRYTIELALPWASLESSRTAIPPKPGDTWRMNVYSFRDGQRDALAWSPILGQGNFHRAARFGRVSFDAPK